MVCPIMSDGTIRPKCESNECLAWRFVSSTRPKHHVLEIYSQDEVKRPTHIPQSWTWFSDQFDPDTDIQICGWEEPESEFHRRRLGYCGLAGKPEVWS